MRLDHFVLFNNHLTTTKGAHMADNTLSNTLSNNGANMSNNALTTPSITRSMGFKPSESVWIEMKKTALIGTGKRVYGRIQDTGCNYIVEGYDMNKNWVRIPCRRLQDAQMLLAKVMKKSIFDNIRS
jgi:hypothetical protein